MLKEKDATDSSSPSSSSSRHTSRSPSLNPSANDLKEENSKELDEFADDLTRKALKQGCKEASKQLASVKGSSQKSSTTTSSFLPFSPIDLTMTQIFCIVSVGWIFALILRYAFLADGKLATRSPASPKPFFPLNSSVTDFYRGDGASYSELYNQADLTILMFYAQWSLHSIEARKHFTRLARSFKDVDNVKFSAVNCDVGKCKRSFKLYSYPVIIALTSSNTAVLYEDFPTTELMFNWINKLMSPLYRLDSINDPVLSNNKYDHVVLAYLPLQNGEITHSYKVYQLAAMKNKERILFAITLDQEVASHFGLNQNTFKILDSQHSYDINVNTTSNSLLSTVNVEANVFRHSSVQWVRREIDDEGGKTTRLHSLVNDTRALLILITTPLTTLQSSSNLEKMRKMALLYNDCSSSAELKNLEVENWAQNHVNEARLACVFKEEMIPDCCNTMWHDNFCSNRKDQSTKDLSKLQYAPQCLTVLQLFGKENLHKHCCLKKLSTKHQLQLTFKQKMACHYLKIINSTDPSTLSTYPLHDPLPPLRDPSLNYEEPKELSFQSHGLSCRTNRTVNFAAMDKRYSGHFLRSWNLNITIDGTEDQLVLVSLDDEALYSRKVNDSFKDIDEMLTDYANSKLEPIVFDEQKRKSHFSKDVVEKEDEQQDEVSIIERLTAETFRTKILNDTDRTFAAVVFFSGGSWHGQSMAVTQVFHTVHHEFAAFSSLIRFFIIDVSRNSLPWSYVFDSLPAVMFFPAQPFPISQSAHFPNELIMTVPNLMAFLLARAQPELRFRVALRGCSTLCLETNGQRLHQFEAAVRKDIRMLRLMKRKYSHKFGANFVTLMLRKRKLQMNASRYLQNVLKILHSNQSNEFQLSSLNETLIVQDSLLLRWLLSNNFGTNFNINHSFRL